VEKGVDERGEGEGGRDLGPQNFRKRAAAPSFKSSTQSQVDKCTIGYKQCDTSIGCFTATIEHLIALCRYRLKGVAFGMRL